MSQICRRGIAFEKELFCAASWTPRLLAGDCTCWRCCLLAGDRPFWSLEFLACWRSRVQEELLAGERQTAGGMAGQSNDQCVKLLLEWWFMSFWDIHLHACDVILSKPCGVMMCSEEIMLVRLCQGRWTHVVPFLHLYGNHWLDSRFKICNSLWFKSQ